MASTAVSQETARIIRDMDEKFVRNVNSGSAEALVSAFYADDAQVLPPHAPLASGRAAILELWEGMIAARLNLSVLQAKRIEESGDLAYAAGVYELSLSPAGGGVITDKGKYVVVYRRQPDGNWRAVADIFNSDRPAG